MPKGTNQKFKLYRLAQIMLEQTDDEHYITMPEIKEALARYDITADRKSIYADLRDLEVLGIEVEGEPVGKGYHYHVVSRPFELPELKLLVDAIQSSKFITEKKTNALIRKLEKQVSRYEAMKLQRQVFVSGRIKTMNESIYYTVDAIHNAISENKKIRFQYYQWNVKKEMELRRDGAWYHISPWGLSWDDENYYLVGYDSDAGEIRHYRVDKMLHIRMSDEPREGERTFPEAGHGGLRQEELRHVRREGAEGEAAGGQQPGRGDHRPVREGSHDDPRGSGTFHRQCDRHGQQRIPRVGLFPGRAGEDPGAGGSRGEDAGRRRTAGAAVRREMTGGSGLCKTE